MRCADEKSEGLRDREDNAGSDKTPEAGCVQAGDEEVGSDAREETTAERGEREYANVSVVKLLAGIATHIAYRLVCLV